ncbi:polyketide synthase, partial [Streptomyces mutomycini]
MSDEEMCSADYWVRHVREAVRFLDGMRALRDQGVTTYLELGPDGVLSAMGQDCVEDSVFVPALRKDRDEALTLVTALAELHVHGRSVDWVAYFAGVGARRVDLPTYAFQREHFWLESVAAGVVDGVGLGARAVDHPLLSAEVSLAEGDGLVLTGRLSLQSHGWLVDHVVLGSVLLPGTAFVELVLYAGERVGCGFVEELTLQAPLVMPGRGGVSVQLSVGGPSVEGRRVVSVHSRSADDADGEWVRHATGVLSAA